MTNSRLVDAENRDEKKIREKGMTLRPSHYSAVLGRVGAHTRSNHRGLHIAYKVTSDANSKVELATPLLFAFVTFTSLAIHNKECTASLFSRITNLC